MQDIGIGISNVEEPSRHCGFGIGVMLVAAVELVAPTKPFPK